VGILTSGDRNAGLYASLSQINNTIKGRFLNWDINLSAPLFGVHIFIYLLNVLLDLICIYCGISKLFDRYAYGHFRLNIATVCLSLEVTSCIVRVVACILSALRSLVPAYSISFPGNLGQGIYYMMLPFTLSSGIFIIFFWIDITSRSLYHGAFLDRFFWPSMILSGICYIFILCTASFFIAGWQVDVATQWLTYTIFFLFLVCSVIYFIAAKSLYRYNKERKDPMLEKEFKKLIIKITLSGIVMLIIIFITPFRYITGRGFGGFYIATTGYVLWSTRSYLLIDLFGTPPKQLSKSTTLPKSSQPLGTNSTPPIPSADAEAEAEAEAESESESGPQPEPEL
jgi:archaellum biogenesis protein FlaJ (TadC family)